MATLEETWRLDSDESSFFASSNVAVIARRDERFTEDVQSTLCYDFLNSWFSRMNRGLGYV